MNKSFQTEHPALHVEIRSRLSSPELDTTNTKDVILKDIRDEIKNSEMDDINMATMPLPPTLSELYLNGEQGDITELIALQPSDGSKNGSLQVKRKQDDEHEDELLDEVAIKKSRN